MANELDKTIEELEAEVLAELEEANGADAPKRGAMKAEPMDKADVDGAKGGDEVQDTGKPVVDGEQSDAPVKKVVAKAKEIAGDPAQKKEGKPDAAPKLKEEEDKDDEKSLDTKSEGDKEVAKEEDEKEVVDTAKMKEQMLKASKSMNKEDLRNMYASYIKASMNKTKDEMIKELSDGISKLSDSKIETLNQSFNSKGVEISEQENNQNGDNSETKNEEDNLETKTNEDNLKN